MDANPIFGDMLKAKGGLTAASFCILDQRVKGWSRETCRLAPGVPRSFSLTKCSRNGLGGHIPSAGFTLVDLLAVRGAARPVLRSLKSEAGRAKRSMSGFTLVELLVVIAIIALLASIVVPALGTAKQAAMSAVCASNLRQFGLAAHMYEEDNETEMPTPYSRNANQREVYWWPNSLAPYLGVKRYDDAQADGDPIVKSVATCPAQFVMGPQRTTYSENHMINEWFTTVSGKVEGEPVTRSEMTRPGNTDPGRWPTTPATIPYFTDGWVWSAFTPYSFASWRHVRCEGLLTTPELLKLAHPHNGASNIAFLDGHVEKTPFNQGIYEKQGWSFWPKFADEQLSY